MKCWRVMINTMGRGTDVFLDKIVTEKGAKKICRSAQVKDPESNYFVQEYEEARVGVNILSSTST